MYSLQRAPTFVLLLFFEVGVGGFQVANYAYAPTKKKKRIGWLWIKGFSFVPGFLFLKCLKRPFVLLSKYIPHPAAIQVDTMQTASHTLIVGCC